MIRLNSTQNIFIQSCMHFGLIGIQCEYKFHEKRKWRFDYAIPQFKIALEVEGGAFSGGRHTRGVGFINDMEKYNTATSMGWSVLRVTPQQLLKVNTIQLIQLTINNKQK